MVKVNAIKLKEISLKLFVKVRRDWRNDNLQLGSLGYRKK